MLKGTLYNKNQMKNVPFVHMHRCAFHLPSLNMGATCAYPYLPTVNLVRLPALVHVTIYTHACNKEHVTPTDVTVNTHVRNN